MKCAEAGICNSLGASTSTADSWSGHLADGSWEIARLDRYRPGAAYLGLDVP